MINKAAADKVLKRLDRLSTGTLELTTPDGQKHVFSGELNDNKKVKLEIYDWSVFSNLALKRDIGFADDYRAGKWETDNLNTLIELGIENKVAMDSIAPTNKFYRTFSMLSYMLRLNTVKGSKKNIHAHYDLGNAFYELWLDPSMSYSSGYFKSPNDSLLQSQQNKYDRMLDCLGSTSGRMLEIGCGWGGLAERALHRGDYDIRGVTISEEQHQYARSRLGSNVKIALEDYRHQIGTYDHIISIEMFEAVGERYWATYFKKVKSLLNKNGTAVIQTITMNEKEFPAYRHGGDFVRSYIFPGGMLPSISRFNQEAEKAGLVSRNEFLFGQDYSKTLEMWLEKFDSKHDKIKELGFDDGFIRLWRFYLAGCAAGFKTGKTNVMQVELVHA